MANVEDVGSVPSIANLSVKHGTKTLGRLRIAKSIAGSFIEMPFAIIKGTKEGPTMWIQGAVHANEFVGSEAIRRIISDLKPNKLSGKVIAIPIVNTSAYSAHLRHSPIDSKDLSASCLNKPYGTFTERFADLLLNETLDSLTESDFLFDLHGGPTGETIIEPWVAYQATGDEAEEKSLRAAEATGIRVIYKVVMKESEDYKAIPGESVTLADEYIPEGRAAVEMLKRKKIGRVVIESGTKVALESDVIVQYNGILNVMKDFGMLSGSPIISVKDKIYVNDTRRVMATNRGFWRPIIQPGKMISKGELLAIVTDEYGLKIEDKTSPTDGILLINRTNSYIDPLSSILTHRYGAFVGILEK